MWSPDWRIPLGILVIPHPSRLRRATFPSGKVIPPGYLLRATTQGRPYYWKLFPGGLKVRLKKFRLFLRKNR